MVARVKKAVRIPVMGSGGIRQAADVLLFLKETQADGAAVARGCLGNPWIFAQAKALVQGNAPPVPPTRGERGRVLLQLIEGEFRHYGPPLALRRLPRTSCYFAKILPNFADFRAAVRGIRDLAPFAACQTPRSELQSPHSSLRGALRRMLTKRHWTQDAQVDFTKVISAAAKPPHPASRNDQG